MKGKIRTHRDLDVYKHGFAAAMRVFDFTRTLPRDERYSLSDQIRRSSRSVCTNLAEAWRKRRYQGAFINKLTDSEGEAAETQVWLEFAVKCGYMQREAGLDLYREYDGVIRTLVGMINHPETWVIGQDRD